MATAAPQPTPDPPIAPEPLIALVEDEDHLAQGLLFNLQAEGYRVHLETDGDSALAWLLQHTAPSLQHPPAAVLLDCMLPGVDGFTIVRTLREQQRYTPVLLLTARSRPEDVLEGMEAGADDYLAKPFDLNILLVRLKSLLRRMSWQAQRSQNPTSTQFANQSEIQPGAQPADPSGPNPPTPPPPFPPADPRDEFRFAGRSIRFDLLELHAPGNRITQLTLMEADLLRYLTDRPGRVISRKEILEQVWRVHEDTDTRAIDNFIVRLRRYIEDNPTHPQHLLTIRGIGYRFLPNT